MNFVFGLLAGIFLTLFIELLFILYVMGKMVQAEDKAGRAGDFE